MASNSAGRFWLLAAALILSAPDAMAAESDYDRAPFALGGESCANYLLDVAADRGFQQLYDAWLSGYMKTVSEQLPGAPDLSADAEVGGAIVWVRNYCRQRRSDSFLTAAVRFMEARERRDSGAAPTSSEIRLSRQF